MQSKTEGKRILMKFKAGFWCTNESLFCYVTVIHDDKPIVVPIYKKSTTKIIIKKK